MSKRIEVKDLNTYHDKFHAVSDVNPVVEPRSVTAFIGPSGCDRSTVLRTLNRMHEVTPGACCIGEVLLDGTDLYDPGVDPVAVRRVIGMVFRRPNPFPSMSIYENVASGLRFNGEKNRAVLDEVIERALRGTNLWKEVKDRPGKAGVGLSSGQQQRLCIARAITVQPDVLLMDEPCSVLGPISTLMVEGLIHELKEHYVVVTVTHNMQQVMRAPDETAFFNLKAQDEPGHLVGIGPTERIFHNPERKVMEDYTTGRFG